MTPGAKWLPYHIRTPIFLVRDLQIQYREALGKRSRGPQMSGEGSNDNSEPSYASNGLLIAHLHSFESSDAHDASNYIQDFSETTDFINL
jgi:hypothetical protein